MADGEQANGHGNDAAPYPFWPTCSDLARRPDPGKRTRQRFQGVPGRAWRKSLAQSDSSARLRLTAGDTSAQTTICDAARHRIREAGIAGVAAAADIVAQEFASLRRRRAASKGLSPLGLDTQSFLTDQQGLSPDLVAGLARDLRNARLEVEMIVAGVDDLGGHLYRIDDPG